MVFEPCRGDPRKKKYGTWHLTSNMPIPQVLVFKSRWRAWEHSCGVDLLRRGFGYIARADASSTKHPRHQANLSIAMMNTPTASWLSKAAASGLIEHRRKFVLKQLAFCPHLLFKEPCFRSLRVWCGFRLLTTMPELQKPDRKSVGRQQSFFGTQLSASYYQFGSRRGPALIQFSCPCQAARM